MDADRSRPLIAAGYGVALMMVAVAATDMLGRMLPVRLGDTAWRLGSVGIVTLSLPTLLLALLIAALTAQHLGHRLVLRVTAAVCVAGSVIMLAVLPFFALDILEMRRLVQPEARGSFYFTMGRAALTVLLAAGMVAWTGYAGWRASSRAGAAAPGSTKRKAGKEDRAGGILVGRQG